MAVALAWEQAAVAIGDINRDRQPDLIFTVGGPFSPSYVKVAAGRGNRSFAEPAAYPALSPRSVGEPGSVAIGDVDADGNPDIVTSGITILFGDGAGGFPRRREYWNDAGGSVILTDLDGDGMTDLFIGSGEPAALSGNRTAMLFQRAGEFSGAPVTTVPDPTAQSVLAAQFKRILEADFNGDGARDLAVKTSGGVAILLGSGDGRFTSATFNQPSAAVSGAIAAGDFNRDGMDDLVVTDCCDNPANPASGRLLLFLARPGGTGFESTRLFPIHRNALSAAAGDFDGDGNLDFAAAINSLEYGAGDEVQLYFGDGRGGFAPPLSLAAGPEIMALASGDFDGDGVADIAAAAIGTWQERDGEVRVFLGRRDRKPLTRILPLRGGPYFLTAGDWNRDGRMDLAAGQSDGTYGVLLALGGGAFGPFTPLPYTEEPGFRSEPGLAAGDWNRDSYTDLFAWGINQIGIFLGNGDGTFQGQIAIDRNSSVWTTADLNRDGAPDLLTISDYGRVAAFLNTRRAAALDVVSAASFLPGALSPGSLATLFGSGIGASAVSVRDSTGAVRSVRLLFVSDNQINFLVPEETAIGPAAVLAASRAGAEVQSVPVNISAVAPSLFTSNPSGLAAAYTLTVAPDGSQRFALVSDEPIDLGPPGTQFYLTLFGTGLRAAGTSGVRVSAQGMVATVTYAGAQPEFAGLDQVNVLVPRELAGSGLVNVALTASGVPANVVRVSVR